MRSFKGSAKGLISRIDLRKMIMKFEETWRFGCAARKRTETVEKVANTMRMEHSVPCTFSKWSIIVTRVRDDPAYFVVLRFQRLRHVDLIRIPS
ncbi:hypothetical protein TNCV_4128291 [Trichonephila clavipes]|nr:hypothetical protein TNCV_4128291 [Trichonephila clavipes]